MDVHFQALLKYFTGEVFYDNSVKHLAVKAAYATDASVYQEMPLAVAMPKTTEDIQHLIVFAQKHTLTMVPRAAGTSLAGQVVSHGIIVDISKYMTSILEINAEEKWVRVQPGVIRDELNVYLKPFGLMFGPETSTSSRAMIGGMIGNNSCGLHSMIWKNTRDNLLEVRVLLSDASEVVFGNLDQKEIQNIRSKPGVEGRVYDQIVSMLESEINQSIISDNFPKESVTRRNSGYALDALVNQLNNAKQLNLCSLIAGSEGTLCFVTEAKLKLIDLPPAEVGMVAIHCNSLQEALAANLVAVRSGCAAAELVDHVILEEAINNAGQIKNRFFLIGQPNSILMVEFFSDTNAGLIKKCNDLIEELQSKNLGYAFPILTGEETKKAWDLRKSGLGLLRNLKGDVQPVNLIEDCAVAVDDLPAYINDLDLLLRKHNITYSLYAHAGDGELHVEPMINLKSVSGRLLFKQILEETATLVKKYKGSLSGEHGDGRLRGQYISYVMGNEVYDLFKQVKNIFDPNGVFNKGKITDTPDMLESLRYQNDETVIRQPSKTFFDFSEQENMLRLTEKCSGSGDCRKTEVTGGTMCPSYMATRNEKDTTRARANILRQYLTNEPEVLGQGKDAEIVKDVLDLCIACKGCKIECPSSVDMTKLRAEFLYHYQKVHGIPFRSKLVGNFSRQMQLASKFPGVYNFLVNNDFSRRVISKISGFHPKRSLPNISRISLKNWCLNRKEQKASNNVNMSVYLFCDEFTNYNDVQTGIKTILLLEKLGYNVIIPEHVDSGRSYLSKGMLEEAKICAERNVELLYKLISKNTPLIGIEPSAILSFRDEYPALVNTDLQDKAKVLSAHTFLFEEWFYEEIKAGRISYLRFTDLSQKVVLHGHCHQKALSDINKAEFILGLPKNFKVQSLATGCCGMAGSFGYEKEHYDVSLKIGNLVLFPSIQNEPETTIIAASGTSCRHQIKDGTKKIALHPAEILYDALL
ncbi:FAD-binding and (Fe-S)-binding domain-containing protein [Mucilaginibacter sp. L196]|uniref:FAD-binding and (Fe-S)-binding domain-containing protein n=1 Tax=Mucilaginibacter sp. L196 TaxID=1641870 RepID=UPI00131C35BB|nr:FAD-binding and (Fe-S)-binding domain-containing protein [Mucilaginibacter sp. L196]